MPKLCESKGQEIKAEAQRQEGKHGIRVGRGARELGAGGAEAVVTTNLLHYFPRCEYFMVQNTNEKSHRKNMPSSRAFD